MFRCIVLRSLFENITNDAIGVFDPVRSKLEDLALGRWAGKMSKLAGSESQRRKLSVPLLLASCSKKLFILWQVDVGLGEDVSSFEQVIKGLFQSQLDTQTPADVALSMETWGCRRGLMQSNATYPFPPLT